MLSLLSALVPILSKCRKKWVIDGHAKEKKTTDKHYCSLSI